MAAVGDNIARAISAMIVDGDFENERCAAAYARGQSDGIVAYQADRKAGRVE